MPQKLSPAQLNDYLIELYESTGECLIWSGSVHHSGYALVWHEGVRKALHRLSWEQAHGPIPVGKIVRHRCDQKLCYRVDHLTIGTRADNARDAVERQPLWNVHGESHYRAKLTEEDVLAIRNSTESLSVLARRYGIGKSTAGHTRNGKTWKHLLPGQES